MQVVRTATQIGEGPSGCSQVKGRATAKLTTETTESVTMQTMPSTIHTLSLQCTGVTLSHSNAWVQPRLLSSLLELVTAQQLRSLLQLVRCGGRALGAG